MGKYSKIAWTDRTWNPIVGCSKVSRACDNCYAEAMARRLKAMGIDGYEEAINNRGKWSGKTAFSTRTMEKPLLWKKASRIFVGSMTDLFHPATPDEWLDQVFAVMALAPQHTFMVLTRRFLSCEPLLGPIDLTDITSNLLPGGPEQWNVLDRQEALEAENGAPNTIIDWVIVGGESGPKARPMHPDWARSLRDQCAAAGVPFLFKQRLDERGCKVELPALDGKVWFEFPEAAKEKAGVAAPAFPTTSRKIGEATR